MNNYLVEQLTFDLPRPQPIRGFPELHWAGKRPFTSTHYFPAQLKESYGDPVDGWMNRIYWGDNLQVMSHLLKEFRGKVDLVYIDPPFDSKAEYKKTVTLKGKTGSSDVSSFEEKQYSDIWNNDEFLQFIYERLILLRELLSDDGVIYIHCDWHKSQYIRCITDEVFGGSNCLNEIIWSYRTTLRVPKTHFGRDHDSIFYYRKNKIRTFNPDRSDFPASEETIKRWKPYADENGFVSNKHFAGSDSTIIDTSDQNKGFNINWGIPRDVWDISTIIGGKTENLNYPTQKPEALLERIIKASTNPGSLVLDCFMGSGTTQAVAMKLGRRFIGADINMGAIQTTTKRLIGIINEKKAERQTLADDHPLYLNFQIYNVNNYDIFRNPVEARDLLIQALEIEKLDSSDVFDGMKDGYKVKIMPVNRIATRKDLNPIISGMNYRELDRIIEKNPNAVTDRIMLVCMGHEPDLAARLKMEIGSQYNIEVEVVDILREKERGLTFKYDAEADITIEGDELVIKSFYPRNLLQKLSLLDENVEDWRELVESVSIDWNYNGEVFRPANPDIPGKKELVKGRYKLPPDYGDIRVKITDLLSESLEMTIGAE